FRFGTDTFSELKGPRPRNHIAVLRVLQCTRIQQEQLHRDVFRRRIVTKGQIEPVLAGLGKHARDAPRPPHLVDQVRASWIHFAAFPAAEGHGANFQNSSGFGLQDFELEPAAPEMTADRGRSLWDWYSPVMRW